MKLPARFAANGVRGAVALMSGTILGQLIVFGTAPILARIYPPEAFGFLSLVTAVVTMIAPAAGLKLESALMLPRSERAASSLLVVSLVTATIISVLTALALTALFAFGLLSDLAALPYFALWTGGITLVTSAFNIVAQFALRAHKYSSLAKRTVLTSAGTATAQIGFGLLSATGATLSAGEAAGRTVGLIPLFISARRRFVKFTSRVALMTVKRYWRFPVIFAPSALLNSFGLAVPVLFVGAWFGVAEAGQWGMANRILAIPLVLIGGAVGQVLDAQFSQRVRSRTGRLAPYYLKSTLIMSGVSVIVAAAVLLFSPLVLPLYLGPGWETAATLIRILVITTAARLVAAPLTRIFLVLEQATLNLWMDVVRTLLMIAAITVVMVFELSVAATALLTSLAMLTVYSVTWYLGWRAARRYDRSVYEKATAGQ